MANPCTPLSNPRLGQKSEKENSEGIYTPTDMADLKDKLPEEKIMQIKVQRGNILRNLWTPYSKLPIVRHANPNK
jgi:hypothetical protein